jgi:hypothetical protein
MTKRKRRWRNMIGVYIRDDAEANLIYIEHVYSFPMYDGRTDILYQRSYGFSANTSFNDVWNHQFDLWAPVVAGSWKSQSPSLDRAAYLQFIGTQEPCTLWGGTWQLVAQL